MLLSGGHRASSLDVRRVGRSHPTQGAGPLCWPRASSSGQTTQHDDQASCAHTTMILISNKEANDMRSPHTRAPTISPIGYLCTASPR